MPAPSSSVSAALASVLLLCACSGGGGRGDDALATISIEAAGGVLEISDGPLAGVKVEVPPAAAPQGVRLRAAAVVPPATPGFQVIGRAAALGPQDMTFAAPVTVTLPYEGVLTGPAPTVLTIDASGAVVELVDVRQVEDGLVEFDTTTLRTCWVADRFFGGVITAPFRDEFLPLVNGSFWTFDNDVTITAIASTQEPHLQGTSVLRFTIAGPGDQQLGFYLRPGNFFQALPMTWLGEFGQTGGQDFQRLHEPSLAFLPPNVTLSQPTLSTLAFALYEPFDAAAATGAGVTFSRAVARHPGPVEILDDQGAVALEFVDVLRVEHTLLTRTTDGRDAEVRLAMTLARDLGPVEIEVFGTRGQLLQAQVGATSVSR